MSLKRNEEQITENQLFATYNLEIPGSSPDWSTIKINGLRKIFVSRFLFQLYYFTSPSHGAVYEDSTWNQIYFYPAKRM